VQYLSSRNHVPLLPIDALMMRCILISARVKSHIRVSVNAQPNDVQQPNFDIEWFKWSTITKDVSARCSCIDEHPELSMSRYLLHTQFRSGRLPSAHVYPAAAIFAFCYPRTHACPPWLQCQEGYMCHARYEPDPDDSAARSLR
jgi:hypothetical protein